MRIMGLFDKFKKNGSVSDWDGAYKANPSFYSKPDGSPFCAFAFTEGTETILPKTPHFAVSGQEVKDYRLVLVSTTKEGIIGECEYFDAIRKLEAFKKDSDNDRLLIRGLSLAELEGLI
jgi:hypothetical protein